MPATTFPGTIRAAAATTGLVRLTSQPLRTTSATVLASSSPRMATISTSVSQSAVSRDKSTFYHARACPNLTGCAVISNPGIFVKLVYNIKV